MSRTFDSLLRARPLSGFLPLVMSALALATVLLHAAIYGVAPEPDEGAAAHIFQLLITAQVPIVAYFAWRWVRRSPARHGVTLAMQVVLGVGALAAVHFLT